MRHNDASSVGNVQEMQNHFTMPQRLVLMPVLENVPCNYKTTKLLAKLSTGDLIALEAKYHAQCLVSL